MATVPEESALAMAQSIIQNAMRLAGISRAELSRRMGCKPPVITRILRGKHNLTVKTLARSLAACGYEIQFITLRKVKARPHQDGRALEQ